MKKDNFQITISDLQKIIAEEYSSMKQSAAKDARKAEIEDRIKTINEELETLPETLEEVEAGGQSKVRSTGWTGEKDGDVKYDEKFEKKGSHLKEDEEMEGELEMGGEDMEMAAEESEMDMGYFESKLAEIGKELDEKLTGESEMEGPEMEGPEMEGPEMDEMVAEMEETKHEPLEGPKVNPEALSEEAVEENTEVVAEEEVNESTIEEVEVVKEEAIEEVEAVNEETVNEEEVNEEEVNEEALNEDLEEPIEGETPAQDSEARFNDYMEKDKHVKEGVENRPGSGLLSEGFEPSRKKALSSELERMAQLAKIGK